MTVTDATTLTFNGSAPISNGDVFIASGTAYTAAAVNNVGGQTVVTVGAPTLDQVFSKLDITGSFTLDSTQVVAQSRAIAQQIAALSGEQLVSPAATVALPFNTSGSGLSLSGSGSLQLQFVPKLHYSSTSGFENSTLEFDTSASISATATAADNFNLPWTQLAKIGVYRIPIPLTIVDSVLNLIGVNVAAIYVPVYIGVSGSAQIETTLTVSASGSRTFALSIAQDGSLSADTAAGPTPASLSFSGIKASPSSSTPVFRSLTASIFPGLQLRPSLLLLNTVSALGIDMTIGPSFTANLKVVPFSNTSAVCGSYAGMLSLEASAFSTPTKGKQFVWPATPYTFDLFDFPTQTLVATCNQTPTVVAIPQGAPTVFVPLTISAQVTPPSSGVAPGTPAPSGQVQISLDGAQCTATINTAGIGSCSLTPSQPGTRTLTYQYTGDSNYSATSLVSASFLIAREPTTATVTASPKTVDTGGTVNFTVTVSPSSNSGNQPLPTGFVTVVETDTNSTVCSIALAATGTASCSTRLTAFGTRQYSTVYTGDQNYLASTSAPTSVTVATPQPTLEVTASATSVLVGETYTVSWSATNVDQCTIDANNFPNTEYTSVSGNRSFSAPSGFPGFPVMTYTVQCWKVVPSGPYPTVRGSVNVTVTERHTGIWTGTYSWSCYNGSGSTAIRFDLVPSGSVGLISNFTGTATYLGTTVTIASAQSGGNYPARAVGSSVLGSFVGNVRIVVPQTSNTAYNEFIGSGDLSSGLFTQGVTLNGDTKVAGSSGCSALSGASGAFSISETPF